MQWNAWLWCAHSVPTFEGLPTLCPTHSVTRTARVLQEVQAQQQQARLDSEARVAAMQKELLHKEDVERAELETDYK